MALFKKRAKQQYKQEQSLRIRDAIIPLNIIKERRKGFRFSMTKKGINIRLPLRDSQATDAQHIAQAKQWAQDVFAKKPDLLARYAPQVYQNGSTIPCFDATYTLKIYYKNRKTIKSRVNGLVLTIELPNTATNESITKAILAKAIAKHYKPFLQKRLNYWNKLFPKPYHQLRIKYNSSNWGSCSGKQNINLSSRLLLCPIEVIDYVIVHELAHLEHKHHGKQFWAEVERVLPDYKQRDNWLKQNGRSIDF